MVWVPYNRECAARAHDFFAYKNVSFAPEEQGVALDAANNLAMPILKRHSFPFLNLMLPESKICEITGDGVHVKQYVDVVRAHVLLRSLCDEETGRWLG